MTRPAYIVFFGFVLLLCGVPVCAQVNPRVPPPPPPGAPSNPPVASADAPATPSTPAAHSNPAPDAAPQPIDPTVPPPPPKEDETPETPTETSGPSFDPLHAQRSLEVGKFYFNKGVYDAAIDRFIESANYQPGLAAPWRYLGEAYEKKHEYAKAAEAYNKYLRIVPSAPDAEKIRKLVSELQEKSTQGPSKKARP